MTIINPVTKKCSICGQVGNFYEIFSTSTFISPDLDTRPPELQRSTITVWIQRCSSCGYCAPNIELPLKNLKMIQTDSYKKQLNNSDFPELTNTFLCWSIIQEDLCNYVDSGWASVHGAWIADDKENKKAAIFCRKRAVKLFLKGQKNEQKFSKQEGAEDVIIIDLLRRSGQFNSALKLCEKNFKIYEKILINNQEKIIKNLLNYEWIIIKKRDRARHTISEAITNLKVKIFNKKYIFSF